jgi:hypothetical protein
VAEFGDVILDLVAEAAARVQPETRTLMMMMLVLVLLLLLVLVIVVLLLVVAEVDAWGGGHTRDVLHPAEGLSSTAPRRSPHPSQPLRFLTVSRPS